MIVSAVVMFFLEASVLGYCVGRLSFLTVITKFMKHWMRAALYIVLAFVPIVIVCISASTIVGLGVMFIIGGINFVLAVGTKGDHPTERYDRVRLSEINTTEEEATETAETKLKMSEV